MEKFSQHLRRLMTERGMTAAQLARETGLSEAAISGYLHGKKEPRGAQSISIAAALGVTLDTLWQTEFASCELTDEELDFLALFRLLKPEGKEKLGVYLEDLINSGHGDETRLKFAARSGGVREFDERQRRDYDRLMRSKNKF